MLWCFRVASVGGKKIGPLLNQFPPPCQQVVARIRLLDRCAYHMGEAQFHDGVRCVCLVASPRSERGSETMNGRPGRESRVPQYLSASFRSWASRGANVKVGMLDRRFSAIGLRPAAIAARLSIASWRANAIPRYGYPPSPISRRLPSMVTRWTQLLEPLLAMDRYNVPPSPCSPCFEMDLTVAAASFPTFTPRSILGYTGIERNTQAF